MYLCQMISGIRNLKQFIASSWIGIIFLSLALISLHQHDHPSSDHTSCSTAHHDHHHTSDHDDCTYCFLYYQQQVDQLLEWNWELTPFSFELKKEYLTQPTLAIFLPKIYSKGLRAPPSLA